jgi:hypothetical protein
LLVRVGAVVPSEHMLFERINASGLGLSIGSIGDGAVRNVRCSPPLPSAP